MRLSSTGTYKNTALTQRELFLNALFLLPPLVNKKNRREFRRGFSPHKKRIVELLNAFTIKRNNLFLTAKRYSLINNEPFLMLSEPIIRTVWILLLVCFVNSVSAAKETTNTSTALPKTEIAPIKVPLTFNEPFTMSTSDDAVSNVTIGRSKSTTGNNNNNNNSTETMMGPATLFTEHCTKQTIALELGYISIKVEWTPVGGYRLIVVVGGRPILDVPCNPTIGDIILNENKMERSMQYAFGELFLFLLWG